MNELPLHQAVIRPVQNGLSRPLWSVMIPTYNCASYLRETLNSVLAQDPGPELMQIEVVDDCSTQDDPAAVVQELGKGRVQFYQQLENVGYIKNFETCLQRSRGCLIHLLHGDDAILDGFYPKMQLLFEQYSEIGAGFCRQILMDECGHWKYFSIVEQTERGILSNWLERIATELTLQPPAMVVRREVYEQLGGFDSRMLSCGEDWEMWCRIAAYYPVGYEPEPLALYRDRSNSLTKRSVLSGQNIRDVRNATAIIHAYLPESVADSVTRSALKNWALWAVSFAQQMATKGNTRAALIQLREALICSRSWQIIKAGVRLILKVIQQQFLQEWRALRLPHKLREVQCQDGH
ncbi:glycosyltransferase family A protein [Leptolyngbya sp. GB1-A1]|uniref:glycosyltransferase family 2 protein n=1 Tax=Leptolyngbya sp. GB1-A1 TaxID=2933908 RepID=UPI0032968797